LRYDDAIFLPVAGQFRLQKSSQRLDKVVNISAMAALFALLNPPA
jgi:hypothetical protein